MKIAAIYDIHGNLPALKAALKEIDKNGVDNIICGGDVVLGPMPCETLDYLLGFNIPVTFISGNCETQMLDIMQGKESLLLPVAVYDTMKWTARQLTKKHIEVISSWTSMYVTGKNKLGKIMFCHATPRNNTEIFTKLTQEGTLIPVFENCGADIVICGHTHMQFDRSIGKTRVVNAGSVGMPYGERGAYWILIDDDVKLMCTSYDFEGASSIIKATQYPNADEFSENFVLRPYTEEYALEVFGKAELK